MTLKPISLSTITSQKAMSLQTQGGHTPTGVGTPLTSEQKQLALKSLKETRYPAETDIALRSMLDLVTSSKTRIDWGDDKRGSKLEISLSSESVYNRARTAVLEKLVPLPKKELYARLTHLTTLLKMPFGFSSPEDMEVKIKAIAQKLELIPADIAIYAIDTLADRCKEWPSWSEFASIVLAKKRNRENILHLLDRKWGERND
jgi:acetylornithine/succinyldiaminopimelate/putrescine aminotransferase